MKFGDKVYLIEKLEDCYNHLRKEIDNLISCGVELEFFDVVEDLFDSYLEAVTQGYKAIVEKGGLTVYTNLPVEIIGSIIVVGEKDEL